MIVGLAHCLGKFYYVKYIGGHRSQWKLAQCVGCPTLVTLMITEFIKNFDKTEKKTLSKRKEMFLIHCTFSGSTHLRVKKLSGQLKSLGLSNDPLSFCKHYICYALFFCYATLTLTSL